MNPNVQCFHVEPSIQGLNGIFQGRGAEPLLPPPAYVCVYLAHCPLPKVLEALGLGAGEGTSSGVSKMPSSSVLEHPDRSTQAGKDAGGGQQREREDGVHWQGHGWDMEVPEPLSLYSSPELLWDETGAPYAFPHHPGLSLGLQRLLGSVYGDTEGKNGSQRSLDIPFLSGRVLESLCGGSADE